jgi:hypothetical protein
LFHFKCCLSRQLTSAAVGEVGPRCGSTPDVPWLMQESPPLPRNPELPIWSEWSTSPYPRDYASALQAKDDPLVVVGDVVAGIELDRVGRGGT